MKTVLYIIIGILIGLLFAGGIYASTRAPQGEPVELRPAPTPEPLRVHVAGAVVRPGVYDLDEGSRVADAVDTAGGFVVEADQNALNLAAFLEDGERLDVPYLAGFVPDEEQGFVVVTEGTPSPLASEDLININTASIEELDQLPGIGETTAIRIIDYRTINGPFATIEDIINVSGIGTATYEELKDLITVGE
ncbi:MAG: ComEA family DNA-binding protein [Anaerolineales bacterium]|jgi:competence protein ComEA